MTIDRKKFPLPPVPPVRDAGLRHWLEQFWQLTIKHHQLLQDNDQQIDGNPVIQETPDQGDLMVWDGTQWCYFGLVAGSNMTISFDYTGKTITFTSTGIPATSTPGSIGGATGRDTAMLAAGA